MNLNLKNTNKHIVIKKWHIRSERTSRPYFVSKNSFINKLIMIEVIEIKNGNKIFFAAKTNMKTTKPDEWNSNNHIAKIM